MPQPVGYRPGDQQAAGEHRGRDRKNQAALRRIDGKFVGQRRHHRLYAIQQGEGGKPAGEQRQHRAHEHRRAFFDVLVIKLRHHLIEG